MNADFVRLLKSILEIDDGEILAETQLDEAGVDSLAVLEIAILTKETFGVEMAERDILQAQTLGDLDRMISEARYA